jgi:hypothetical protein
MELVSNSMDSIEIYRQNQAKKRNSKNNELDE